MTFTIRSAADFGKAISELRRANGQTQEEFAPTVGLSRAYLAQFERGRLPRTVDMLLTLLGRLGATVTITTNPEP